MRLASLKEFRALVYTPDSAPTVATLRANIEKIPGGQKVGGRYYVDLDAFDQATNISAAILSRRDELAKNPALQALL